MGTAFCCSFLKADGTTVGDRPADFLKMPNKVRILYWLVAMHVVVEMYMCVRYMNKTSYGESARQNLRRTHFSDGELTRNFASQLAPSGLYYSLMGEKYTHIIRRAFLN